jgi:hypothetical protein
VWPFFPLLESDTLYRQFRLDEPWDSPNNRPLAATTPNCYEAIFGPNVPPGLTHYQLLIGPGTAFERPGLTLADFPDGLRSTILAVEAPVPVPWSKPGDPIYDPTGPVPTLGMGYHKLIKNIGYRAGWEPGFTACFADGSARFLPTTIDDATLRALITRNGGEPLKERWLK